MDVIEFIAKPRKVGRNFIRDDVFRYKSDIDFRKNHRFKIDLKLLKHRYDSARNFSKRSSKFFPLVYSPLERAEYELQTL